MASDGVVNLKGAQKAQALVDRFGLRGVDYIGNAKDDLPVWRQARNAIVVNATTDDSPMRHCAAYSLEASDRASSHKACSYYLPDARLPRPVRQLTISFPHDALGGDVFWFGCPSSATRKEFVAVK